MYLKELEAARTAAVKAGKAIMEIYHNCGKLQIAYKDDKTPLTLADKASNDIIVGLLAEKFPAYAILSEEEKDNKARLKNDYCFVIDPLDGTKEFIKRNGQFTVNISLVYRHKSVMGVIYVPVTEELYYASEGNGSFREDRDGQVVQNVVSNVTDIEKLRLVMSSSHDCPEIEAFIKRHHLKNFVPMGSSLKGCMVARGDAELYYRYNPTMEWDTAAMQCIAEEAGAIFRQMDDGIMYYNRENSRNEKGFYIINNARNRLR